MYIFNQQYLKMKFRFTFLFVFIALLSYAQKANDKKIRDLLTHQTASWNKGDIEGFMQTYWHSDSLMFIGKNGVTKGWQQTLNNYRKGYPDTAAMGKLSFDIIQTKKLSKKYYYVVGKWMLKRTVGDLSGHFDLLLKKIKGRWYIIADHSS